MRQAFTLIELIVVMAILSFTMAIILPKGYKLLESFEKRMNVATEKQQLSVQRAWAFLSLEEKNVSVGSMSYHISTKGLIIKQ